MKIRLRSQEAYTCLLLCHGCFTCVMRNGDLKHFHCIHIERSLVTLVCMHVSPAPLGLDSAYLMMVHVQFVHLPISGLLPARRLPSNSNSRCGPTNMRPAFVQISCPPMRILCHVSKCEEDELQMNKALRMI